MAMKEIIVVFLELLLLHLTQIGYHLRYSESSSFRTSWERNSIERNGILRQGVFIGSIYLYTSIDLINNTLLWLTLLFVWNVTIDKQLNFLPSKQSF